MAVDVIAELRAKRAEATDALEILLAAAVDEEGNARDFNDAEEADFQTPEEPSRAYRSANQAGRGSAAHEGRRRRALCSASERPPARRFQPELRRHPREPEAGRGL